MYVKKKKKKGIHTEKISFQYRPFYLIALDRSDLVRLDNAPLSYTMPPFIYPDNYLPRYPNIANNN